MWSAAGLAAGAASAAPDNDALFDPEVARQLASVKAWHGFYTVFASGNPSAPSAAFPQNEGSRESSSYGTFELTRDRSDGSWWDPGRGQFAWSGTGEVRASHRITRSQWARDGSGFEVSDQSGGTLALQDVQFTIHLGRREARFGNGVVGGDLAATQRGYSVTRRDGSTLQSSALERHSMNQEGRHAPTLPAFHRLAKRIWQPIDWFSQVAAGPAVVTVSTSYPTDGYTQPMPGDIACHEQLVLFPVYDDVECEVTIAGYDEWRPLGSITDPAKPGNGLVARAVLTSKTGKNDDLPEVERFRFELIDTSREPGVCLNWPLRAQDDNYDLRLADFHTGSAPEQAAAAIRFVANWGLASAGDFDHASRPAGALPQGSFPEIEADGQKGELANPPKDQAGRPYAEAAIECFDFGARSELRVICFLRDGREILGLIKGTDGRGALVRLPKRGGADWIAESWRQNHAVPGLPAHDDEESVAGQPLNGDGFTLYEEYRGWAEQGRHREGDPKRKDLFVLNSIGADAKDGIALFGRASQLRVHADLRPSEIVILPTVKTEADANAEGERIMNLNHRDGPHRVDQHAVQLINTSGFRSSGAAATGVFEDGRTNQAFRPGKVQYTRVEARGVHDGAFSLGQSVGAAQLAERDAGFVYDRAVAHELLHAVGVDHHGEGEQTRGFYFQAASHPMNPTGRARFVGVMPFSGSDYGKTVLGRPAVWSDFDRGPSFTLLWEDTGEDVAESLAAAFERELAAERGNPLVALDGEAQAARVPQYGKGAAFWNELTLQEAVADANTMRGFAKGVGPKFSRVVTIGPLNAADSGNELCLMRYYFATAYPVAGRERTYYLVRPGTNRAGRDLCRSPEGTGANAADHQPQSRFGDSAPGRGRCFNYVCPNDAIPPRDL
jgi:hypothetical protein